MYAHMRDPWAADNIDSAWLRVSAFEGRPGWPLRIAHRATTLRFTLSRAMARLIARSRHPRMFCTVLVL